MAAFVPSLLIVTAILLSKIKVISLSRYTLKRNTGQLMKKFNSTLSVAKNLFFKLMIGEYLPSNKHKSVEEHHSVSRSVKKAKIFLSF